MLKFVVYGIAQPKGSTRAFVPKGWKRAIVTTDNPKSKGWQQLVAEAASRSLNGSGVLLHGAVKLSIAFYLPRPKSLPKKCTEHVKKPDTSKLIRSTEDALTGVVWRDDSQVVELAVTKRYAGVGESPRAIVTVEPLDAAERMFHATHAEAEETRDQETRVSVD